jgi:hypothetical protein
MAPVQPRVCCSGAVSHAAAIRKANRNDMSLQRPGKTFVCAYTAAHEVMKLSVGICKLGPCTGVNVFVRYTMSSWDFECGACDRIFPSGWKARDKHCKARGHSRPDHECDTCARYCRNERNCWKHMNIMNHFAEVCSMCDETWPNAEQREQHEHDDHLYCQQCDRSFQNRNNLKMVILHRCFPQ